MGTDPDQCTAMVGYAPVASDNCDGDVTVVCNPASMSILPKGPNHVTCTATDLAGNSSTCQFDITIYDVENPAIACPTNMTVFTTNTSGATVTYTTPAATDNCDSPTVSCVPASDTVFVVGTTTVTCTATDTSLNASTCSFTITVEANHPPVASDGTLGAVENHSRSVLIEKLLSNVIDADDDLLTITAVSATSTNGGTVTLGSTYVVYMPATNFVGTDRFTFTVSDGHGGTAVGTVVVSVMSENDPSMNRVTITMVGSSLKIRFAGIPGNTYTVERSSPGAAGPWIVIGTFTVPDDGIAEYLDTTPPSPSFYRTALQ